MGGAQIRISWVLDVVDRGVGAKVLAQDRLVRTSIAQTDAAVKKSSADSVSASTRQAEAMARVAAAADKTGTAQINATGAGARYVTVQKDQIDVSSKLVAEIDGVTAALNRQTEAAKRAGAEEAKRSKVRSSGGGVGAVATGALKGIGLGAAGVVGGAAALVGGLTVSGLKKGAEIRAGAAGLGGLTGLNPKEATALAVIAQANSVSARGLGTAFATLGKQVVGLQKHEKEVAEARAAGKTPPKLSAAEEGFGKLGISGKQATSLQNNLPALFDLVYQRAQKLPAAQQANVLKTFLGRGATLGGQVELGGPLAGQIKSVGGQLGHLDPKKLTELHETEIHLKEETTALELGFAQTFGPPLIKLLGLLAPAIKPFGDALREIAGAPIGAIKGAIVGVKSVLDDKRPPAAKGIQGDTANIVAGVGAGLLGRPVATTAVRGAPSTKPLVSRLGAPLVGPRADKEPFALKPEKIKQEASGLAQVGEKVGGVLRLIGKTAGEAGQELLQAFKPAMPFVTNIVLPGLKLVGKYLELVAKVAIVANVVAFHVFVAVLKVAFTALGAIGIAAKATVGFFTKLAPAVAKVAVQVGGFFGSLPGVIGSVAGKVGNATAHIASEAWHGISSLPGKLASAASSAGHAVVGTLGGWIGKAGSVADSIAGAIVSGIASIPGRIESVAGRILGTFEDLGAKIVGAIVGGIKGAIGTVSEAFSELQPRFDVSVNPLHPHFHLFFGKTKVFRGGGMVDAMVSPGEQIVYGGSSMMVPGMPTAADSVMARLPVGAAVLTFDGQERIAQGASLGEALMSQRPHFQKGGEVVRGKVSTFGPPGEAAGTTASGASSSQAGVAIRPGETWQSGKPTLGETWLIQIGGHAGPLQQIDLGPNQSTGRRIDVTGAGAKTLGIDPLNFPTDSEGTATLLGAGVKLPAAGKLIGSRGVTLPIMLAKSKTREGLLPEALKLGVEAGSAGLTSAEIARANRGVRGAEKSTIVSSLVEKLGAVTKSLAAPSVSTSSKAIKGAGGVVPTATWNPRHLEIASWIGPYLTYGASHEWAGTLTSGYRPRAEQERIYNSGVRPAAKPGTSKHEQLKYPGGAVDVTDAAQLAAALTKEKGPHLLQWAGSRDPVHFSHPVNGSYRRGGIAGRVRGRIAGIGRRLAFRAGGKVPPSPATPISQGVSHLQATAGSNKFAGALSAFNEALEGLTVRGLEKYRALFVREARKPGSAAVIKSLQAAISSIDYALGLRIGNYFDQITKLGTVAERGQANLDRSLRKQGIDPASARGLSLVAGGDDRATTDRRGALAAAQKAVAIAKKTGNRTVIAEATEKLHAAQDELDEAITKGIEDRRNMIRTAAQEASDAAAFGVSSAQNSLAGLDIAQRVNRTAETPGGLSQKVSAIQAQLLPALEGSKAALERQLSVLQASGASASELDAVIGQIQTTGNEVAGAMAEAAELIRQAAIKAAQELTEAAEFRLSSAQNALSGLDISQRLNQTAGTPTGELEKASAIQSQILPAQRGLLAALNNQLGVLQGATPAEINAAMLQIQTAASDIGNSMAEAAELIREAAEQAAQETVDRAGHGTSMAQLGEQKLELEQRLGGTYEAGASQRADYITSTLIPALDTELSALQTQFKVAGEQGNTKLAEQIGEAIASKQNDILQAQLEAMEDVASNTNQRKLGGVLGFSYGNEDLTDALVGVGSGA